MGDELSVVVQLPFLENEHFLVFLLMQGKFSENRKLSGFKGAISHASLAMYSLDETHSTPGCVSLGNTSLILSAGYGK